MTTETKRFVTGTFCWADFNSKNPAAAKAFYTGLFGWGAEDLPTPAGTYTMFTASGKRVAALQALPPEAEKMGAPAHWLNYIAVDDVDAHTQKARALGAKVLSEAFEVMDAGRMSVLADPSGAVFSLWQGKQTPGSELVNGEIGSVCWHDLYTADTAAAKAFYTGLFEYGTETNEIGGTEFTVFLSKNPVGPEEAGMCNPGMDRGAYWQPFFSVADADATVQKAVELGAQVICPPMDMGDRRFAHLQDPEGVTFGIFQLNRG